MAQPWDLLLLPAAWAFLLGAPLPAALLFAAPLFDAPLFDAPHLAAPFPAAPFPADSFPADPFPAFQFFCTTAIIRALRHSSPATVRKEHLSQLPICRCRVTAELCRVLPNSAEFCRVPSLEVVFMSSNPQSSAGRRERGVGMGGAAPVSHRQMNRFSLLDDWSVSAQGSRCNNVRASNRSVLNCRLHNLLYLWLSMGIRYSCLGVGRTFAAFCRVLPRCDHM